MSRRKFTTARNNEKKKQKVEFVARTKLFTGCGDKTPRLRLFSFEISAFLRDFLVIYVHDIPRHDISAAGYACEGNCHGEGNLFGMELSDSDSRQPSNSIFRFDARLKGLNSELRGLACRCGKRKFYS